MNMRRIVIAAACGLMALRSSLASAAVICPAHESGAFPWAFYGPRAGDLWAWTYLDIDRAGYPLRCHIGANNLSGPQALSDICSSFFVEWRARPLNTGVQTVAGTTRRLVVLMSAGSRRQFTRDRTRWFADHPTVSRDCFPEVSTSARIAPQ